jgi:hypothetical protein
LPRVRQAGGEEAISPPESAITKTATTENKTTSSSSIYKFRYSKADTITPATLPVIDPIPKGTVPFPLGIKKSFF